MCIKVLSLYHKYNEKKIIKKISSDTLGSKISIKLKYTKLFNYDIWYIYSIYIVFV